MSDIELFKNCKVDNINRVSNFTTLAQQNAYYTSLHTAGNGIKISGAVFNKLGLPFLVNYPFDDIVKYSYGRVKLIPDVTGTPGIWYYFSIDDFEVNTNGKTQIIYTLDPWETARVQLGATLGNGLVEYSAAPFFDVKHPPQDMQPLHVLQKYESLSCEGIEDLYDLRLSERRAMMYKKSNTFIHIFYRNSTTNKSHIYVIIPFKDTPESLIKIMDIICKAEWANVIGTDPLVSSGFTESNILGAWLSPLMMGGATLGVPDPPFGWQIDPLDGQGFIYRIGEDPTTLFKKFPLQLADHYIGVNTDGFPETMGPLVIETTDTKRMYITDLRGNELWECPLGRQVTSGSYTFDISPTTMKIIFQMDGLGEAGKFTMPCEPLPLFVDSYTEYFARQRDTDIKMRKQQNDADMQNSFINIGQSMLGGAIVGGMADKGTTGVGVGAAIGAAASAVGTVVTWANNDRLAPKFQAITDDFYKNQKDELSLVGDSITAIIQRRSFGYIVTEIWDQYSQTRFKEGLKSQGYKVNYPSAASHTFYKDGALKGDFEIKGDIPQSWKAQIRNRFSNGVLVGGSPRTPVLPTYTDPTGVFTYKAPQSIGTYTIGFGDVGTSDTLSVKAAVMFVKTGVNTGLLSLVRRKLDSEYFFKSVEGGYTRAHNIDKIANLLGIDIFDLTTPSTTKGDAYINGVKIANGANLTSSDTGSYVAYSKTGGGLYTQAELDGKVVEFINVPVVASFRPATHTINGLQPIPTPSPVTAKGVGNIAFFDNASTFNATVIYVQTGVKKGIISIVGKYTHPSPYGQEFSIASLSKIAALVGKNFKTNTDVVTGYWDSYDIDAGYGPKIRVVGDGIEFGRIYTTRGDFGEWPETVMAGKNIKAYEIEVEEV